MVTHPHTLVGLCTSLLFENALHAGGFFELPLRTKHTLVTPVHDMPVEATVAVYSTLKTRPTGWLTGSSVWGRNCRPAPSLIMVTSGTHLRVLRKRCFVGVSVSEAMQARVTGAATCCECVHVHNLHGMQRHHT